MCLDGKTCGKLKLIAMLEVRKNLKKVREKRKLIIAFF